MGKNLMTAILKIFRRFPKNFQNLSEGHTKVAEHFSKNALRLLKSRKTRKCFDHTPTNLSKI